MQISHRSTGRLMALAALVTVTLSGVVSVPSPAAAVTPTFCSDATPPALLGLRFTPKQVDARLAPKVVTFTADVTDDLSGVGSVRVEVVSPSNSGVSRSLAAQLVRVAGTRLDGMWKGTITLAPWTNKGSWTVTGVQVTDRVGHYTTVDTAALVVLGSPTSFEVLAHPDVFAPAVQDFGFRPHTVDTRSAAQRVKVHATVTDRGGSRVRTVIVSFGRYDPIDGSYGSSVRLTRRPGTDRFVGRLVVPVRADRESPAVWDVSLFAIDRATNQASYSTGDLHNAGWPRRLKVVTRPDSHPPRLTDLTFSPDTVDASAGPVSVSLVAHINDRGSGVRRAAGSFSGGSGTATFDFQLSGGSRTDGSWGADAVIPRCATGIKALYLTLTDATGNAHEYTPAELLSLGFPAYLTVTSS